MTEKEKIPVGARVSEELANDIKLAAYILDISPFAFMLDALKRYTQKVIQCKDWHALADEVNRRERFSKRGAKARTLIVQADDNLANDVRLSAALLRSSNKSYVVRQALVDYSQEVFLRDDAQAILEQRMHELLGMIIHLSERKIQIATKAT